jgi:hypothetical protein
MIAALIALAATMQAADQAPPPPPEAPPIVVNGPQECGPPFAKVYIAPMGQPFRTDGFTDPAAKWFAQADADHDGKLTFAEFAADADRYFTVLDRNHDGEIDPQEMAIYENQDAPEIKLYQPGQYRRPRNSQEKKEAKAAGRQRADYQAPYGAGLWASLNIPEPVVSADLDLNRGVSRAELAQVASSRFQALDSGGQGVLSLATLPRSPAQSAIDDCRARAAKKKVR